MSLKAVTFDAYGAAAQRGPDAHSPADRGRSRPHRQRGRRVARVGRPLSSGDAAAPVPDAPIRSRKRFVPGCCARFEAPRQIAEQNLLRVLRQVRRSRRRDVLRRSLSGDDCRSRSILKRSKVLNASGLVSESAYRLQRRSRACRGLALQAARAVHPDLRGGPRVQARPADLPAGRWSSSAFSRTRSCTWATASIDDVKGAKAAGMRVAWINRTNRPRRSDGPAPDFEIRDLTELPAFL